MRRKDMAQVTAPPDESLRQLQRVPEEGPSLAVGASMTKSESQALDLGRVACFAVRSAWRLNAPDPGAPRATDHVFLVRGMPVAPWMQLRPVDDVWAAWLRGLQTLWLSWRGADMAPAETTTEGLLEGWDEWQARHLHALQFRRAEPGSQRLAELLASPELAHGEAHLIGHSVGGAAVLRYLTGVRAGSLPAPRVRVRAAVTLDAALSGIAGVWSGARTFTRRGASEGLAGLGAWARRQELNLITICNERDIWSHRAVDDLPYVGLRLGPPFDLGAQLNGAVHGWLRRMPQIVDALWANPATGDISTQPLD